MIELLILYILTRGVLTMYGIKKSIIEEFSYLLIPSIGTIKPALNRLNNKHCITFQKTISKGGRPSVYYSITSSGREELKRLILDKLSDNPVQFLNTARVKLYCANFLNEDDLKILTNMLKLKAETIYSEIVKKLEGCESDFYPKMILDNLSCEYKNFISLTEGLSRAGKH